MTNEHLEHPNSLDCEDSILGIMLLDPSQISIAVELIDAEAFYSPGNQKIFAAMIDLYRSKDFLPDIAHVHLYLKDRNQIDFVGGQARLAQLLNRTVSNLSLERYIEIVKDKFLRRRLIEVGNRIVDLGYQEAIDLEELLDLSEQQVYSVSQQRRLNSLEPNSSIAYKTLDFLDSDSPIYETGWYDLDELLIGLEPQTLTVLAGRPSMGKSAIALNLTFNFLINHNLPVAFFSLEMTKEQIEQRLWSLISKTENFDLLKVEDLRKYRAKKLDFSQAELDNLTNIVGRAAELPLHISDDRGISVNQIASECRQFKAKGGNLGLVVVDYLQMMSGGGQDNRSYDLGNVARGLYKLAGELKVPVLALSQISRGVEQRQDKRPMMSDLSQSGIIEMVADNILFAYRDEYYNPDSTYDRGILELILAKGRHSPTGKARLQFDKTYGAVSNVHISNFQLN